MGSSASTLADLARLRARGQRPEAPVVIADAPLAWGWARRHCEEGTCIVDRRDVRDELTAFVGLDVWVVHAKEPAAAYELALALIEDCRFVTLIDATGQRRSEFVSSIGARA